MSYKDLFTVTSPNPTVAPDAHTADVTGATVDRKFNESAIAVLHIGTWTDGTHDFTFEESDDSTTWNDVAASDLQGSFSTVDDATTDDTAEHVGYLGSKRYLRVSTTVTGTTSGAKYSVAIVTDYPRFSGAHPLTP